MLMMGFGCKLANIHERPMKVSTKLWASGDELSFYHLN
jgi:hypothetical protein